MRGAGFTWRQVATRRSRGVVAGLMLALALSLVWAPGAGAVQPGERLPDPQLEQRARNLSAGLRCLVCQNQSIDDSDAPLAQDLRRVVRQRLVAGDSDAQVRDFVVARYGSFVLLKPPLNMGTLLLWAGPGLVLIAGGLLVWAARRRSSAPVAALSEAERAEVAALLADDERDGGPGARS